MTHNKSVEILSIFRVSSPPAQTQSPRGNAKPPIENFLATFLVETLTNFAKGQKKG